MRPDRRRAAAAALALAAAGAGALPAHAAGPAASAAVATGEVYPLGDTPLAITGHGYGHGHGMGQYGAQGAALRHIGYRDILAHYYPGTTVGALPAAPVRVRISEDGDGDLTVRPDAGLALADADGARWVLPAGPAAWRVRADAGAAQHVEQLLAGAWQPWTSPSGRSSFRQLTFSGPARVRVDLPGGGGRAYRGTVTALRRSGSAISTVNTVDLERYLWGVVPRESPASWQPDALRAQAVAARTYAAWERQAAGARGYDTCSTSACQVYGGSASYTAAGVLTESEPASSTAAVQATAGEVRRYGGQLAFTQFTSSTGGMNAAGGQPYLAAGPDPWDDWAGNPVHTWTASLTAARVAAAYPAAGTVRSVRVVARDGVGEWGGRTSSLVVQGVTPTGTPTAVTTSGADFAWRLGLRSPWWAPQPAAGQPAAGQLGAVQLHWLELGGASSWLGAPLGPEHDVPGGRAQDFAGGTVYWSPATGARAVRGAVLARYLALGGPGGPLGLPTTDELAVPGGAEGDFVGGRLLWSPTGGALLVRGAVGQTWAALGGAAGRLGLPLGDEEPQAGGVRQRFAAGNAYWTPATAAHAVTGPVLSAYVRHGEAAGLVGPPVGDEVALPGGSGQGFRSGLLMRSAAGVYEVHGAVLGRYLALGGAGGLLGMPTADEAPAPGSRVGEFRGGRVWWSPGTGAHEVHGAILATYLGLGGPASPLGPPTTDEYAVPGGRRSDFTGGALVWQAAGGAVVAVPLR